MGLKLNQAQKIIKLAKRLAAAENVVTAAQVQGQKPSLDQTRNAHKAFRLLHVYVHQLAGSPSAPEQETAMGGARKGGEHD